MRTLVSSPAASMRNPQFVEALLAARLRARSTPADEVRILDHTVQTWLLCAVTPEGETLPFLFPRTDLYDEPTDFDKVACALGYKDFVRPAHASEGAVRTTRVTELTPGLRYRVHYEDIPDKVPART